MALSFFVEKKRFRYVESYSPHICIFQGISFNSLQPCWPHKFPLPAPPIPSPNPTRARAPKPFRAANPTLLPTRRRGVRCFIPSPRIFMSLFFKPTQLNLCKIHFECLEDERSFASFANRSHAQPPPRRPVPLFGPVLFTIYYYLFPPVE